MYPGAPMVHVVGEAPGVVRVMPALWAIRPDHRLRTTRMTGSGQGGADASVNLQAETTFYHACKLRAPRK
eukprot:3398831-Pyramimonas_sp.AAC.1